MNLLWLTGIAWADDPGAIQARTRQLIKTISSGDAQAVAGFWTPSGEYTRGAMTISGRANIQAAYAEYFKKKPSGQLIVQHEQIRFLAESVAIADGAFVADRENPADVVRSSFHAIFVKTDGGWYLGMLREEPAGPALEEFAWMLGEWTFKSQNMEGRMSVKLAKKQKFMLVETTVKDGNDEEVATQVIGIDPATGKLKSWTFESDGSIGTSEWVRTEAGWRADVSSTTGDGELVRALTIIKPSSRNAFTFESIDRTIDGEKVADIAPVQVTRIKKP